jgi:hypothetical protein
MITSRLKALVAKNAVYEVSDRVNFTSTMGYEHFGTPGRFYISGKTEKELFGLIKEALETGEEYILPLNEFLPSDYSHSPLRFDLDRKVEGIVTKSLYSSSEILRVYASVIEVFHRLFNNFDRSAMKCIVSTKPNRVIDNCTKQGVHLQFPDLFITPVVFQLVTREVKKIHSDVDENVVTSRQWLLYGACKSVASLAYKATHIIQLSLETGRTIYSTFTPSSDIAVYLSISEHRRNRFGMPVKRTDLTLKSLSIIEVKVEKDEEECHDAPEQEDIDFVESELDRVYGPCELLERPKRFGGLCFVYKRLGKHGERIAQMWSELGGKDNFEKKWEDVQKRVVYTGLKKLVVEEEVKEKKAKKSVSRVVRLGLKMLEEEALEKESLEDI